MTLHLEEISGFVAADAHAVLVMDQAGWHTSSKLDVPANISILTLPSRSPELNPIENIWQFLRDNWLSNRVFSSRDDIVDHCSSARGQRKKGGRKPPLRTQLMPAAWGAREAG